MIEKIAQWLYDIWQEAKSSMPDNWDDVTYESLSERDKGEYHKSAQRLIALIKEAGYVQLVPDDQKRIMNHVMRIHPLTCGSCGTEIETKLCPACAGYVQQREKCLKCEGTGEIQNRLAWDIPNAKEDCPDCNGTGRVLKYVELAEDQTPPGCGDPQEEDEVLFSAGQEWMLSKMLTPHKEGERMVAFRKIIMESEKDVRTN